ncbi:methylated-DNA-[protein]-cysteine S-methyltransferase [Nocardioides albertanoniae]|uniref:Methylated-DNA--protein-cysteine methyltransferase n=1 Tax=Nocardioides albertanoniae TaxID=1175486 RepID=A0A543AA60_9ACTN|nr:methylated-DNA--[protein]-cysteine S-methyltransferase [Nocardioides albertanoniae]TQL69481.1 methylated-DNA-[protein]-cysteine S-methyltransferase [Nocardioides albertanoniae]
MWTLVESPVGQLRLVANDGAITAIEFMPADYADGRVRGDRADDDPLLVECARQLAEYFAGDRTTFDLPLSPAGTAFQERVWDQLQKIDYGTTCSYGQIAGRLSMTGHGARAVGLANGRNPIPIVIPCHRVVGADGSLTGYAGGLDRKTALLGLESGALF